MAALNGNCVSLYVASGSGTPSFSGTEIDGVTSCSISLSNATFETTSIQGGSCATVRDFAVGTTSGSLSVEGIVDESLVSGGTNILFNYCDTKTQISMAWGDGTKGFGAVGYCTSFEISAGMDDFATFSASFEIDGLPVAIGF